MVTLKLGKCLELLPTVPDNSIDLICADMPYGTTECKWDTLIPLEPLWQQLKRVAKERAAIILFGQTPFDKVLGASNLKMLKYEWIWEKTNATGFLNAKKMPLKAHENVLVFYKKLPVYNAQKTYGHPRKTAGRKASNSDVYGKNIEKTHYDSTERYPRSVLQFKSDRQKSNMHPTQKPLSLLEYIVKTYSNLGETVLDFCMGSGTAGVAAKKLQRNFIGFEKEAKYFHMSEERIGKTEAENNPNSIHHTSRGAYITHSKRVSESESKILAALDDLRASGTKINKTVVAGICGISREQLSRRYQHLFVAQN